MSQSQDVQTSGQEATHSPGERFATRCGYPQLREQSKKFFAVLNYVLGESCMSLQQLLYNDMNRNIFRVSFINSLVAQHELCFRTPVRLLSNRLGFEWTKQLFNRLRAYGGYLTRRRGKTHDKQYLTNQMCNVSFMSEYRHVTALKSSDWPDSTLISLMAAED